MQDNDISNVENFLNEKVTKKDISFGIENVLGSITTYQKSYDNFKGGMKKALVDPNPTLEKAFSEVIKNNNIIIKELKKLHKEYSSSKE